MTAQSEKPRWSWRNTFLTWLPQHAWKHCNVWQKSSPSLYYWLFNKGFCVGEYVFPLAAPRTSKCINFLLKSKVNMWISVSPCKSLWGWFIKWMVYFNRKAEILGSSDWSSHGERYVRKKSFPPISLKNYCVSFALWFDLGWVTLPLVPQSCWRPLSVWSQNMSPCSRVITVI